MSDPRMDGGTSDYDLLEVSPTASAAAIKAAYRTLAREYHPDGLPEGRTRLANDAAEKFKRIAAAYATLSDPGRRRAYDEQLRRAASSGAAPRGARPRPTQPTAPAATDAWVEALRRRERRANSGAVRLLAAVAAVAAVAVLIAAAVSSLQRTDTTNARPDPPEWVVRRARLVTAPTPTPTPAPAVIVYRDGTEQPVLTWRRDGELTHFTALDAQEFVVRSVRIDFDRSRAPVDSTP